VGSTEDQDIPLTLALQAGEGLTAIAAGAEHSCGLVSGGSPRRWGAHDDGRLGSTTNDDATSPQSLDGDLLFTRIAVGAAHACGRTADHQVKCWGAAPASGATASAIDL
jgi:alpha-tubulin suppressor-like RCC1 family protein